ncbi:MAG: hypothetical protein ACLT1W_09115 [Alistipes onderdonkii]
MSLNIILANGSFGCLLMQARYLETAERIVFGLDDFLFDSQIVTYAMNGIESIVLSANPAERSHVS